MCGICGDLTTTGESASVAALQAMTECMRSRGPDSGGLYHQDGAGFGHRRLSIIDLSAAAQQPMVDSELGLAMVYNGCVYNFPELREELEGKGYRFFSNGDTEVVLKAYHAWGTDCVRRFNGMFAFAIRQRDTGRVVLARDRLGIKPLYYTDTPGDGLRFASSLPALLRAGGVDTEIDPVALHYYLTLHAVVPAPRTILKGVRKLPPATIMTVEPGGERRFETYWRLESNPDPELAGLGEEDWKRRLLQELEAAIHRRMIADVPVGVLLSGGLDSSLVVGMLAANGQQGLETFSIGFEAVGEEAGDEFQYSDIVAERFATRHHKMRISPERTLESLGGCIAAMSEPMVSHDAIGFYLLSQEVSRHVKVVQSGQGADEVFGGYHWYPPMMETDHALATYARAMFDRDHDEYARTVHPRLAGDDHTTAFVAQHFAGPGADRAIDKALRMDTTVLLVDDPVKRVDNMTMAWGLEARVPFLDHELVEFAARMPAELKVREGGKYILKEAARSVIPAEVIDRPKGYFPVPALKYLRGQFLATVRDALTADTARQRRLFNHHYVHELLADPERHITPLRGSKLWQLGLLELWLQAHDIH